MTRTTPARGLVLAVGLSLLATACGTRLNDSQIAADALKVSGTAAQAGGAGAAGGAGGATSGAAASGTGGGLAAAGSGGGTTGGAAAGSGTTGSGGKGGGGSSTGSTGGSANGGGGGTTGGAAPGAPILLGNVGDYSGLASSSTAGELRGIQVWAAAVNAKGGVAGHPVKLQVADAGGDPQRGKSFVQDFVENKKVVALVGSAAALSVSGWAGYLDGKKVPAIGGDCGAVYWNQHPMLFNNCPATETSLFGILSNGVALAGKGAKWGELYCVESPDLCGKLDSLANQGGLAKKAGLTPVYRAGISITQPDFTSECLNLRNNGAQTVSVYADANSTLRVARACAQQNYHPLFMSGSIQAPTNAPSSPGLDTLSMMVQTIPFQGVSTPAYNEFKAAMGKYGGDGDIGTGELIGWLSGKIFEEAVKLGGGVSTAQILAGLYKFHKDNVGGLAAPITYLPGKPTPDSRCWFTMQAKGGKWTAPIGTKMRCW